MKMRRGRGKYLGDGGGGRTLEGGGGTSAFFFAGGVMMVEGCLGNFGVGTGRAEEEKECWNAGGAKGVGEAARERLGWEVEWGREGELVEREREGEGDREGEGEYRARALKEERLLVEMSSKISSSVSTYCYELLLLFLSCPSPPALLFLYFFPGCF